jgi:endonuclease/exonuclease/phosphatase family metal-dependent hydrolase
MAARRTTGSRARGTSTRNIEARDSVVTASNDRLSAALKDLVPDEHKGTDKYLDVVQWNIEWFGAEKSVAKDRQRLDLVIDTLESLNADLFVFQEIAGPSADGRYPGALDVVAEELTKRGAGHYVVFYTQAGGEQRVAMMWDRDWLRAKGDVTDLFPRGTHMMPAARNERPRDAFAGRTPLYGHFTARVPSASTDLGTSAEHFEFQVLGVHLKAMGDGHPQRLRSSEVLVEWYEKEAQAVDGDILIMGDFNAPPSEKSSFKPFWDLEDAGQAGFRKLNDESDFSYMWLRNQTDKFVSRIDLTVASLSAQKRAETLAKPIRWKPIEETLAQAGNLKDAKVREVLQAIKENLSDHLPCVSRFYFGPAAPGMRGR